MSNGREGSALVPVSERCCSALVVLLGVRLQLIMDSNPFHSEYFGQTVLHPLGLLAAVILGIAILVVPRRYAVVPILAMACFIAPAQRVAIFSLNFDLLRVMLAFGALRVLIRREYIPLKWQAIDTVFVCWSICGAVAYLLLWGSIEAVKGKSGQLYDQLGLYFLFRCVVRQWDDFWEVAKAMALLSIPVMVAFIVEFTTGRNMFSVFGGVPETTLVREGRLRCQGAFAHPILAGCFWAAQLPLIAVLWYRRRKVLAVTGSVCAMAIIAMCASSTPVAAAACAGIAAAFFLVRRYMRWVRWGVLLAIIGLHLVMKAPVWHLLGRFDFAGGSTGWHRVNLLDQTINHVSEWWLVGTQSVAEWGVFSGDITNQFVLEGIRGGLLTLVLFIAIVAMAFARVGNLWRSLPPSPGGQLVAWALGASLFVHMVSFLGVSYFGQIIAVWYLLLATIASLSERAIQRRYIVAQPATVRASLLTPRPGLPGLR